MSQIIHVPAAMLSVSPLNVRKKQDEAANLRLRAHIVARGLLQNLIGIPVPRKKGRYEITAGGRRLTQIHAAIAANELAADYLVPVLIMTDREDAEEDSLAENFHRLNMTPAEECIAFQAMIQREKRTPADIAKRWGLTERYVLGRLRLANLAECVFEALREGEITLDTASAYGATSDTAAQSAVFAEISRQSYHVHPDTIRRRVQQVGYTAASWKVRLIDRDAYLAAGGRIDGDLFSDQVTETWLDRTIVDALAAARMEVISTETRETQGFACVRIVEDEREIWSEVRHLEILEGTPAEPTEQAVARRAEIATLLGDYEARAEDPDADEITDEEEALIEGLQDELDSLDNPAPILSDEEKGRAIAFIFPGADGKVYLHNRIYAEPRPQAGEENLVGGDRGEDIDDGDAGSGSASAGNETVPVAQPEKSGISQRLAGELAIQKTELIALHVASDPHFALDLGLFIMADRAASLGYSDIPSELRASAAPSGVPDFSSDTQAAQAWGDVEDGLDKSWTTAQGATARFDAFRALDQDAKGAWLGWCVARTLRPVDHGRSGCGFLDHIATTLAIDAAAWWRPTAANYFDRVSKTMILGAFEEVGGPELRGRYAAAKKGDLSAAAEKLFRGDMMVKAETKAAAISWLPPSMTFANPRTEVVAGADEATLDSEGPGDQPEAFAEAA